MAKWISVLFSDIRNKLGDAVVFSNWKGRTYFRSYVIPANPKTLKQQANRDHQAKLVARWKNIMDTEDKKGVWNAIALPEEITGYNLFVKYGRKSKISCPSTASGSGSASIEITYTIGNPAPYARLIRENPDGTLTDITPAEGLSPDPDSKVTDTVTSSGTYKYYLADSRALVEGDAFPQDYSCYNHWKPDYSQGVAVAAECEVTIS